MSSTFLLFFFFAHKNRILNILLFFYSFETQTSYAILSFDFHFYNQFYRFHVSYYVTNIHSIRNYRKFIFYSVLFDILTSISLLVTLSIQFIFNILLQQQISNAPNVFTFRCCYCLSFPLQWVRLILRHILIEVNRVLWIFKTIWLDKYVLLFISFFFHRCELSN